MSFQHEALLYRGPADFADRVLPIIAAAVEDREPVLVAIDAAKIALLRERLGAMAESVAWRDIRAIGGNPARIIPLWRQFLGRHPGRRTLGFGEPVWAGRSPAELVEAQRHEALLNLAFAGHPQFTLLCPYDTRSLAALVVEEASHTHHAVRGHDGDGRPGARGGPVRVPARFAAPLLEPAVAPVELRVDGVAPAGLRAFLVDHGVDGGRADHLTIAAAAVLAGMGRAGARLRAWLAPDEVVVELAGLEPVDDPLAGREWPAPGRGAARGLWLANQVCDLVEVRSLGGDAVVRLHVRR
jgi:MEDS: MEthanogen/methylotroph, DcmR Sensory domain